LNRERFKGEVAVVTGALDINLLGAILSIRTFADQIRHSGHGSIVSVTSVESSAVVGVADSVPHLATLRRRLASRC